MCWYGSDSSNGLAMLWLHRIVWPGVLGKPRWNGVNWYYRRILSVRGYWRDREGEKLSLCADVGVVQLVPCWMKQLERDKVGGDRRI